MRTRSRLLLASAVIAGGVVGTANMALAHHAFFDFTANGPAVPDGAPDGTAEGTIDFNSEVSPDMCIEATTDGLGAVTAVEIRNISDDTLLVDFGTMLSGCVVTTDEQREAMHDTSDLYRIVISTEEYPEGAVAGTFVEQEPTTTTSSTTLPTSSSTTASTATSTSATVAPIVTVQPNFTG